MTTENTIARAAKHNAKQSRGSSMFIGHSRLATMSGYIALSAAIAGVLYGGAVLAAEAPDSSGLQEIIVTAQRVQTDLQKTPVSITAFSAENLQERRITSLLDLTAFTPNLQVSARSGSASQGGYAIRGMGVNSAVPSASPSVGIYIDDAYFPSQVGSLLSLFDVAQVEVLRGPQGTLFGRNTIAGAIQYTTVKPSTDGISGFVEATGGNFGHADFSGALNVPMGDTFAMRLSLASRDKDGYVHDIFSDVKRGSDRQKQGRLQARWTPTDKLTIDLKAETLQQKSNGRPITVIGLPIDPVTGVVTGRAVAQFWYTSPFYPAFVPWQGVIDKPGTPQYSLDLLTNEDYANAGFGNPEFFEFNYSVGQADVAYELTDNITLTSITAYSRSSSEGAIDADDTPVELFTINQGHNQTDLLTQELRLSGRSFGDKLDWTGGAFYYDQDISTKDSTFFVGGSPWISFTGPPPGPGPFYGINGGNAAVDYGSKAWALYGQATYHLTDRLSGTVGLRYSSEKADIDATSLADPAPAPGVPPGVPVCVNPDGTICLSNSETFTNTSPYVGVNFQATPDAMIYGKASKGFRAGGFQGVDNVVGLLPFDEETAWTYEIGSRMEFLNKRLRVNPTVFYTDWKDIQFNSLNDHGEPYTRNAGDAVLKGVELEMQFAPTGQWLFDVSGSYLDAYYTRIDPSVGFNAVTGAVNLSLDTPLQQAPEFKYTVGARYTVPLAIPGRIVANASYSWVDTVRSAVTISDAVQLPSYGLLNAQVQYIAPDNRWSLAVFGTNVTDEYYNIGGYSAANGPGPTEVQPGRPQEYGATVRFNF